MEGRATEQTRIYDMGQVARYGLDAETVRTRAREVLTTTPKALRPWGFDCEPLHHFWTRLEAERLPADEIIELFDREKSIPGVLRHLVDLQ